MKHKFEVINMSLWQLKRNQKAQILGFEAGVEEKFLKRLQDMGLFLDSEIHCVQTTPFGGPKLYTVEGTVLSLTPELADFIKVKIIN